MPHVGGCCPDAKWGWGGGGLRVKWEFFSWALHCPTGLQILLAPTPRDQREDCQQSATWGIKKKKNGKKASEVHSFQQQTLISKGSVSLVSKGRVTGPRQSTTIFYINVYWIYTDTNTYLKNLPTLSWTAEIESYCASSMLQCKIKWIILNNLFWKWSAQMYARSCLLLPWRW